MTQLTIMSDSQFSIKLPTSVQYPKTWINSTFSLSTRDSHSTQFILDCTSNNLPPECITVFIVFIHNCLPCQDCYIVNKTKLQKPKNFFQIIQYRSFVMYIMTSDWPGCVRCNDDLYDMTVHSHSNSHTSQHYVYLSSKYVISDN